MPLNAVAKIAITVAASAAQMALAMSQKIEGPRLDSLDANLGDFGAPLPRFWGVSRFDGTPIIFAEKFKEKKKTQKTKGGKFTEYKYYGTWAVAVADHEIDAIRGIWLDRHLCYQARGVGPLTPTIGGLQSILNGNTDAPVKLSVGRNLRIYLGTEAQEPDPRYEAWCEDRYGEPDMAPAFKGVAYLVFIDIPLEKFGNRLPQVSVEAVRSKIAIYPYDIPTETLVTDERIKFSPDFRRVYNVDINDAVFAWDVPTRTQLLTFPSNVGGLLGISPEGAMYGRGSAGLLAMGPDGGEVVMTTIFDFAGSDVFYVGGLICLTPAFGLQASHYYSGDPDIGVIATGRSFVPNMYFEDLDGNPWAVGEVPGQNKVGFVLMPNGAEHLVDTTDDGPAYAMCNENGEFLTWQAGKLFVVDPNSWTAGTPTVASMGTTSPRTPFINVSPQARSIWLHNGEYDARDASHIRTVTFSDWHAGVAGAVVYDPINNALITGLTSGGTIWLYLDKVSTDGVPLSSIVSEVCSWSGIEEYDATALDQLVKGYAVVQGTGREMIEPLLSAHFASARPHGFTLEFIKLGSSPSGDTIATADFATIGNEPRFSRREASDKDLPRKVTINFADSAKDYQTNNVIAQRGLDEVSAVGDRQIDMTTYVGTSDEMRPLGDRFFRQQWLERETVTCALTPREIATEPGDVRRIALDGKERTVRAEKVTFTAGALKIEWKRTHPSLAELSTNPGAPMDGRDEDTVYVAGPSKGLVLDIPLADDAHAATLPQLYYGAGKYLSSAAWPGAVLYKGDVSGTNYNDWAEVSSSAGMTWGYATEALADANPRLWDRGNSVNIDVRGGTLSSVSEADIEDDPSVNLAFLGGELINFTTATLEGDGTYTLSGFKRGRRGTEWACGDHAAGEEFAVVSSLVRAGLGLSEVETTEYFKAATLGQDPDGSPQISFEFTGASLKPYAPARIIWSTDGTDMFGEIIRRTRLGGSWADSGVVPLSENSEAYEVEILDGMGEVLRTISVTGTNTFTYAGADITADGNTVGVPPSFNAYQLSDSVGRGFPLAA